MKIKLQLGRHSQMEILRDRQELGQLRAINYKDILSAAHTMEIVKTDLTALADK